ncbi:hypothetical protein NCS55_01430100 [Fusarium keratoplasticum]|nr:hypothetical protein NCS55_01430100 [Fusarium keratoplasticum]
MPAPPSPERQQGSLSSQGGSEHHVEPTIEIEDVIVYPGVFFDADASLEPDRSYVSLSSSIMAYREENGRRYHAHSSGKYVLPNDGVIGVDLSPIQPSFVPPNLVFEIDDLEKEWTWTKKFDFIFARMMLGCFQDFLQIIKVAFDNLEPGGYLELQDMSLPARSDGDTLHPDSQLSQWCKFCFEAGQNLGRPVFPTTEYKNYLAAAGFEDIVEVQRKWPTNAWPRDKHCRWT